MRYKMFAIRLTDEEMLFLYGNTVLKIDIAPYEDCDAVFLKIEEENKRTREIPLYAFYSNLLSQNEMENFKFECQDRFFAYIKEGVCKGNIFIDLRKNEVYYIFDPIARAIMGAKY